MIKSKTWTPYNIDKIKGRYLYRFMSEKNLLRFLYTGDLWFPRSDVFGDKMECVRLSDILKKPRPDFEKIEIRKRQHLICCFHESTKESIALWDTYFVRGHDRRNYAIKFRRTELVNLIEKLTRTLDLPHEVIALTHGKVKYKTLIGISDDKLTQKKIAHVAFRKEYSFSYEREYRFDILLSDCCKELGFNFKLGNPNELPFEILVNPLLESSAYKKSIMKLKQFGFDRNFQESALAKWLKPELW